MGGLKGFGPGVVRHRIFQGLVKAYDREFGRQNRTGSPVLCMDCLLLEGPEGYVGDHADLQIWGQGFGWFVQGCLLVYLTYIFVCMHAHTYTDYTNTKGR